MRHDCQGPELVPKHYGKEFIVCFECPACGAWFYPLFFLDAKRAQFHCFAARPNQGVADMALKTDVRRTIEEASRAGMPLYDGVLWVRSEAVKL